MKLELKRQKGQKTRGKRRNKVLGGRVGDPLKGVEKHL